MHRHSISYRSFAVVNGKPVGEAASIVEAALVESEETAAFPAQLTDDIILGLYSELLVQRFNGK